MSNQDELIIWAKKQSPFLKLMDGEEVEVIFKGYQFIQDPFDPKKQKVQYILEEQGEDKFFNTSSTGAAFFFGGVSKGTIISIIATGEGLKRRYSFNIANKKESKEDITEIPK